MHALGEGQHGLTGVSYKTKNRVKSGDNLKGANYCFKYSHRQRGVLGLEHSGFGIHKHSVYNRALYALQINLVIKKKSHSEEFKQHLDIRVLVSPNISKFNKS